ncbi:Zf-rbx1 domain-containing protein [Rhizoctonia solani]|uniref:Zf-rbx1 domain-containing protein n=1 Tax=Rhizoctonia solani TaxID=456999 RepID=A0A8H8SXG3_9AGAM|nr:Zf-rbx1 domain-containing protein [Rhizoctonia solani]QRW20263.1 Zf-rbx1 domain-containing protein [Rhizoctonia solani]
MDHDHHGNRATNNEHEEDQRDAMEVDGTLDVAPPDRSTREPPAFDENTERPRQRRRYHVTVQDEIRDGPSADNGNGDAAGDDVEVLEAAPPRMSELSIDTPTTTTPPGEPTTVTMRDPEPASPRISTIPLPEVPPPPQPPLNPVMEAARRLTTSPDATNDQMQADLALLAPYIAAQAMAAAFPAAGRPPGGPTQGNAPPQPNAQAQEGQAQGGQNNNTNNGLPPLPPFFFGLPPFMFGGNSEAPADPKRAERLANGLKVVEDGLLKRWKAVCGEQGAVCAVCYSELLEEPGIESEKEKEQLKEHSDEKVSEVEPNQDTDEHQRDLLEAVKRREEMEKLEEQEKARKLETAVLAFPCGHVFHRTCLLPWLSRHTTCPTCRFDIDPKSDTLVLPAEDELPPFMGGPGGLNFGDYFTVGPVLRVPRSHIPGFGPGRGRSAGAGNRPGAPPPANRSGDTEQSTRPEGEEQGNRPEGEEQGNRSEGNAPEGDRAAEGGNNGNATPTSARSVAELFDALLGSILAAHAGAGGPPRPPRQEREGAPRQDEPNQGQDATQSSREEVAPDTSAPVSPTADSIDSSVPDLIPIASPSQETSQPTSSSATSTSTSTPHSEIQARTLDYDRPMAMFGRPTPRRPPQAITPAWMRQPRPANAPALRVVPNDVSSAPSPRAVSSPTASTPGGSPPARSVSGSGVGSGSGSGSDTVQASSGSGSAQRSSESGSSTTQPRHTSTTTSPIAGFGQLRAIVSNLIPRRLSTSRSPSARASNAPSDRSNASTESVARGATSPTSPRGRASRGVTSPTSPRGVTSPIFSPREGGLRAMLHGPAALLRDLTTPSSVRRTTNPGTNDMPSLESDSETFSEDDANQSDEESEPDDLPALEPIDERTRAGRRAPPEPEPAAAATPASEPAPAPTSASAPQQPPRQDNHPADNIITLRIDLGHADGRDETIIVPLLFNPHGRPGNNNTEQNQNQGQTRPAQEPRRARTPPPLKKWTPPEPIKTFRQVVEEKEREAGWRCDDPACLLGPADDEEPTDSPTIKPTYSIMRPIGPDTEPVRYKAEDGIRVYAGGDDVRVKGENPVCAHMLHPECLVTSARVNGYGPEHGNDAKRVALRCPVCRLEGAVERHVWDAGVQADE